MCIIKLCQIVYGLESNITGTVQVLIVTSHVHIVQYVLLENIFKNKNDMLNYHS